MATATEVIEQTREFNDRLSRQLADLPPIHTVPIETTRRARRVGTPLSPAPEFMLRAGDVLVPARDGREIQLRVLAPKTQANGIYLHMHGGGFAMGRADEFDRHLWGFAEATSLCIASIDYRLAPENPFPAGPDDCEDAALWLLQHGAARLGAAPVFAIGGESAGAYLAVTTLLRLRDFHGLADAFSAANLVYGLYDLSGTPSRRLWDDDFVITRDLLDWLQECFMPGVDPEARRTPDRSPLYADLRSLPPALFTVGTRDALVDDTVFMEARWRTAGNVSELRTFAEAGHGFALFPIEAARISIQAQAEFLKRWF